MYNLRFLWQAKLQNDVSKWVSEQMEAICDATAYNEIHDTLNFVELLRRTTNQLTPADHAVVEFLRKININCYDIASRRIDVEVYTRCSDVIDVIVTKRRHVGGIPTVNKTE